MTKMQEMFLYCINSPHARIGLIARSKWSCKNMARRNEYSVERAIKFYYERIGFVLEDKFGKVSSKDRKELSAMLEDYYRWEFV